MVTRTQKAAMYSGATKVPVGFSEALGVLSAVATFLVAVFGKDWGVAQLVQDIAAAGPVLIPLVLSYTRAMKHRTAALSRTVVR